MPHPRPYSSRSTPRSPRRSRIDTGLDTNQAGSSRHHHHSGAGRDTQSGQSRRFLSCSLRQPANETLNQPGRLQVADTHQSRQAPRGIHDQSNWRARYSGPSSQGRHGAVADEEMWEDVVCHAEYGLRFTVRHRPRHNQSPDGDVPGDQRHTSLLQCSGGATAVLGLHDKKDAAACLRQCLTVPVECSVGFSVPVGTKQKQRERNGQQGRRPQPTDPISDVGSQSTSSHAAALHCWVAQSFVGVFATDGGGDSRPSTIVDAATTPICFIPPPRGRESPSLAPSTPETNRP